jgi:hypothetical protein
MEQKKKNLAGYDVVRATFLLRSSQKQGTGEG